MSLIVQGSFLRGQRSITSFPLGSFSCCNSPCSLGLIGCCPGVNRMYKTLGRFSKVQSACLHKKVSQICDREWALTTHPAMNDVLSVGVAPLSLEVSITESVSARNDYWTLLCVLALR